MGRSVKKGPFVQPKLLERVQKMNEAGEKIVLKTWSRSSGATRGRKPRIPNNGRKECVKHGSNG